MSQTTVVPQGPQGQPGVAIIGAGIVGLATAMWLTRQGCPVVLIDRRGAGEATSFGNAGGISPASCTPIALPGMLRQVPGWLAREDGPLRIRPSYALRAAPWLLRFLRETTEARVRRNSTALHQINRGAVRDLMPLIDDAGLHDLLVLPGHLTLYRDRARHDAAHLTNALREASGHPYEVLNAGQIREIEPELSSDYTFAVRSEGNGFCRDPYALSQGFARHLQSRGAPLLRREVQGFIHEGSAITGVQTDRGPVMADRIVLCAGIWSKQVLAPLGLRVALESQRGYHVAAIDPNVTINNILGVGDRKVAVTPMNSGLRVAGTVEFSGIESAPDPRRAKALIPALRAIVPRLKIEEIREWSGHRPCTPDSLPILGPTRRWQNLLLGFGHGHQGLMGSGPTGRILADLVLGRDPGLDLGPYAVDRF